MQLKKYYRRMAKYDEMIKNGIDPTSGMTKIQKEKPQPRKKHRDRQRRLIKMSSQSYYRLRARAEFKDDNEILTKYVNRSSKRPITGIVIS